MFLIIMNQIDIGEKYVNALILKGLINKLPGQKTVYMPEASRGDLYIYMGEDVDVNVHHLQEGDEIICLHDAPEMNESNFKDVWVNNWTVIKCHKNSLEENVKSTRIDKGA